MSYEIEQIGMPLLQGVNLAWADGIALFIVLIVTGYYYYINNQKTEGAHLMFVSPQAQDGIVSRGGPKKRAQSRNIAEKFASNASPFPFVPHHEDRITLMANQKTKVVIFWGSQSGKSERLAKSLARELRKRYRISAIAADLDDYDHRHLVSVPENVFVGFIVSTFGEGDPSDNAVGLQEYLRQKHDQNELSNMRYFAFGLGNSKYQHFNKFVNDVDKSLGTAGAQRVGFVGRADEALRCDTAWADWKDDILVKIASAFGKSELQAGTDQYQADFKMVDRPGSRIISARSVFGGDLRHGSLAVIKEARILSQQTHLSALHTSRDYLHIELEVSPGTLNYQTGDHIAIWPINNEREIDSMCRSFGWDENVRQVPIDISPNEEDDEISLPVSTLTTREALLKYYLDIGGPVSRETIEVLLYFAPTASAKQFLESVIARNGESLDTRFWTISTLMQSASPEVSWPATLFDLLIQQLPLLQPRYYSIASSPVVSKKRVAITVAVVVIDIPGQKAKHRFYGLTTNYLYSLAHKEKHLSLQLPSTKAPQTQRPSFALKDTGNKVLVHLRSSPFKLPNDHSRPIIMMAAGSGIAPFRAFIQERVHYALNHKEQEIGRMILYFGCRSPDEDCLYAEEWKELQTQLQHAGKQGLFEIQYAFSRSPKTEKKTYVQDLILEHYDEFLGLLSEKEASCYICGSINLAVGVKQAMKEMLRSKHGWDMAKCDEFLGALKSEGRLKEDVWA
jgi:NADPH-ferrihemoprotein reductase